MTKGDTGDRPRSGKARHRIRRGEAAANKTRIFLYLLFTFVQRIDSMRRETFAGDLDLASIIHAISESTIEPAMRDAAWREEYGALSKVVGVSGQRGANALSISQATGIPRETARRKIKKLIALGALTEVGRGEYIITPGYLQRSLDPERLDTLLAHSVRFINEGLDYGFYAWSDSEK